MRQIFLTAIFLLFSISTGFAQDVIGGGGGTAFAVGADRFEPGLGSGGIGVISADEIQAVKEAFANANEKNSLVLKLNEAQVEALMSSEGDYARLDDIRDEFVLFKGVHLSEKNEIYLSPYDPEFEIEKVILNNGLEVSPALK